MTPTEMFEAGLCKVIPTVLKECQNDYISPNGTCYEDSCCTSFEAATSWHYRLAQMSHIVFSCAGIVVVVIYKLRFASKHMLPDNVRFLVNIMLLLIVVHSVDMTIIHVYHIFQSFQVLFADPCSIRQKVSFCAPFRYTFSFCTLTLAICQYCIYIDRLFCAFLKSYAKHQKVILFVQLLQLLVLSVSVIKWVYRNEQPDSYLLSCLNVPSSSVTDMAIATAVIFPVNLLCFALSICLFRHFKRKEKGSSSRFDITRHFTAAVDVESSEFLYRTTGIQAFFLALFSVTSLMMRFFYYEVPRTVGITMAILSYIFSIYSFAVPLVMVRYARTTTDNRKSRILVHVGMKSVGREGADHYFGMMKSQWE